VLTFPLAIVTLGIFLLVINALMLMFAASFLPGIEVHGFWPAFWAALLLAILGMLIRGLLPDDKDERE
jgi:putative membrane protein